MGTIPRWYALNILSDASIAREGASRVVSEDIIRDVMKFGIDIGNQLGVKAFQVGSELFILYSFFFRFIGWAFICSFLGRPWF